MKYEYHTIFLTAPQVQGKKAYKNYEYEIDGIQFSRDLQETIHNMAESGYELFQTIPLISSKYLHRTYTEGVTVIFRKQLP